MKISQWRRVVTTLLLGVALGLPTAAWAAQETKSQPSDRTVDFLKTFVEGFLIPDEIPVAEGQAIKVDRSNPEEMKKFEIPRDDMRRVIRIAYSGATAEICDRIDLQENAYKWMQSQEIKKGTWSKEQLFFISRLFVATVMWQTGKASVSLVDEQGAEKVNTAPEKPEVYETKKLVCTDSRKETVKKLEEFLKTASKS